MNRVQQRIKLASDYPTISDPCELAEEYKDDKKDDTYYMRYDVDTHGGGNDQPCVYIDDHVEFGEATGMEVNHVDIINEWVYYNYCDEDEDNEYGMDSYSDAIYSLDDETRQEVDAKIKQAGYAHCCFNIGIAFIYKESKCDIEAFANALLSDVNKVYKYNGDGTITRVA